MYICTQFPATVSRDEPFGDSRSPVMALFILLQKEFISGLTSGAMKG
jgi:hypothetical protein